MSDAERDTLVEYGPGRIVTIDHKKKEYSEVDARRARGGDEGRPTAQMDAQMANCRRRCARRCRA